MVRAHDSAVQAQQVYAQKAAAYAGASEEMVRSRQILNEAKSFGQNVWNDVTSKSILSTLPTSQTEPSAPSRHDTPLSSGGTPPRSNSRRLGTSTTI